MTVHLWIAYAITELVLSLTPGPAVLYVSSQGLRNGFGSGVRAGAGVVAGNTVYFALSGLGLGALIVSSARLFTIVKWAGALYLAAIGVRMILARRHEAAEGPAAGEHPFVRGVVVQLANPKALLFFSALLPQFIAGRSHVALQFTVIGITSILVELPVLIAYAFVADRSRRVMRGRSERIRDRVAGSFLVATGAKLALLRTR